MKTMILLFLMMSSSLSFAAGQTEKLFRFKLMSVTCQLENNRFVTASCRYLAGHGKGPCSISHMGTEHAITASDLKSGKYHIAPVGEHQYVTWADPDTNGASVCFGYESEGKAIIITGEMIDNVTVDDMK